MSFLSPRSADVNNYATYLNAAYRIILLLLLLPCFSEYHGIILHQRLSPVSPTSRLFFFWRIPRYVLAFFSWCLLSPKGIQNNEILPSSKPGMYTSDITRTCSIRLAQQRKKRAKTIQPFLSFLFLVTALG